MTEYYADSHGHGDINFDGIINDVDYELFISHWRETVDPNNPELVACDLYPDQYNRIDLRDLGYMVLIRDGYCPICDIYLTPVPTLMETINNVIMATMSMVMMMMIIRRIE